MRKVLMLALLVLGTASFASVKPITVKGKATKEISIRKHKKHLRKAKKLKLLQPKLQPKNNSNSIFQHF